MIFFLYGADDFRAKEKIKELKQKFLREVDQTGAGLAELEGENLNLTAWHEAVSANSLFARRRLLVITRALLNKDKDFLAGLLDYFKNNSTNQDNILIFYEPDIILDKKGEAQVVAGENTKALTKAQTELFVFLKNTPYAQCFNKLNNLELDQWLKNKLANSGFSLDYQANKLLVGFLGNDLWMLNNEVDKIISYQAAFNPEQKIITSETVAMLVENKTEENIFALMDAISNKNRALALKLLSEQFDQGVNEVYLLTMLTRQVKILLAVRSGLNNGMDAKKIGQILKVHPYVLQKSLNQARNFNAESLKIIFSALVKLDFNYKTGKLSAPLMMSLLLARL